jgi:pyruvate/2-oxoglutarate dehydrogenase complex dihydrolipoamide dehydrogenase (E3) component/uncharacterized membrane protein YdjX (TVP38/TMEM64 family)
MKRALLLALLGAAAVAWFAFDGAHWFSLATVRGAQADIAAFQAARPLVTMALFFGVYVLATALSLPGAATVLTLLGGALFGLLTGSLLVSFASSLGATLAMLMARTLLREPVQRRFGGLMAEVDQGIARDGPLYLISLRLVPLFPFFVVNLLMGLTTMRVVTYHFVSQAAMLPATLLYVNAGTQLARIDSTGGLFTAPLALSFTLLGLFPLLARRAIAMLRRRRAYAPWRGRRPRRFDRNLVVIGAGAAGLVASYAAAAAKAKVTLVEMNRMGGDCLNTGCVPSKALIRSAALVREIRGAAAFGVAAGQPRVDFAAVMGRVAQAVREVAPHDSVERYRALGVDVVTGRARIVDPWHVEISAADGGTQTLSTRSIVIATGAAPVLPAIPGLADIGFVTSETLWSVQELPRRLCVLGGGAVGCEMAQAFAMLGAAVTLVEQAPRLLAGEDDEVCAFVQQALEADGVIVLCGQALSRCGTDVQGRHAWLGSEDRRIDFDLLLCAVGRRPRVEGLGLEALGVPVTGTVQTDEHLRTRLPNILAAGDVAGPWQLTHAAGHQGWAAAVNALAAPFWSIRPEHRTMPACVFTHPEVARVGLNERDARARGVACELTRFELAELDRAITDGAREGFVRVLTEPGRDRILGATLVGARAGEGLALFALAMKQGLGLKKILGTVQAYPTWAEATQKIAGAWQQAHAPARLLAVAEQLNRWRRGS